MVNFLRNDIADLLRNGNAEHAFGRMDELINDMNRLACYDMIEKFCEDVVIQLPVLQKQREFPPEDREAMSTLIFAAARFSDLPELCDLREAFQARYGKDMEMSVNPEFKEKLATRAFSASRKLQLMKNIASEFSVNWNSEAFEYRITNPTSAKCDQQKKRDAHQEIQDPKALPVNEKDGLFQHVVTNAKGIHVMKHEHEAPRQIKPWAKEPENTTPSAVDASNHHAKLEKDKFVNYGEDWGRKNDSHRVTSRAREVLDPINQDRKAVEQPKSRDERRDRSKVPPNTSQPNGTDAERWSNGDNNYKRTSRAQVMQKPNGEQGNIIEQAKLKDETRARHGFPPVQQDLDDIGAKESHDVVYKRSARGKMGHREERKQAIGHQEFEEDDTPRKVPLFAQPKHMNDVIGSASRGKEFEQEKSRQARQGADIAPQDGHVVEPQKPNNNGSFHMIPPPYVKSSVSKVGTNSEHAKSSSQPTDESVIAAREKSSSRLGHVGMSAVSDERNSGAYKDLLKDELVADDERPKPRSVRRKQYQKPPVAPEVDCTIHDDEHAPRTLQGQRRHSSRQNTFPAQDGCDDEEMFMDKLLMHYSKKGLLDQASKRRTTTRAVPPDYTRHEGEAGQYESNGRRQTHKLEDVKVAAHADHSITNCGANRQSYRRHRSPKAEAAQFLPADCQDGGAMLHQAFSRHRVHRPEAVHPPERTASLCSDTATPKGMMMSKGPARATSMQPDLMSPHTDRQLPDYEDLTARFAALRRL